MGHILDTKKPRRARAMWLALAVPFALVLFSLAALRVSARPAGAAGHFRLDVEELVSDDALLVRKLSVTAAGSEVGPLSGPSLPVALRSEDGSQVFVASAVAGVDSPPCRADVLVVGDLTAPRRPGGESEVKVLLRVKGGNGGGNGGHAGGLSRWLTPHKRLADVLTVSAKSGTYPLDTPLTIGTLNGEPLTLVVGETARPE